MSTAFQPAWFWNARKSKLSNLRMSCLNCLHYNGIILSPPSSSDADPGLAVPAHAPTAPQLPVWPARQDLLSPPASENMWGVAAALRSFILAKEFTGSVYSPRSERCPLSICYHSCCSWRTARVIGQSFFSFCVCVCVRTLVDRKSRDEISCRCISGSPVSSECATLVLTESCTCWCCSTPPLGRPSWLCNGSAASSCCIHNYSAVRKGNTHGTGGAE